MKIMLFSDVTSCSCLPNYNASQDRRVFFNYIILTSISSFSKQWHHTCIYWFNPLISTNCTTTRIITTKEKSCRISSSFVCGPIISEKVLTSMFNYIWDINLLNSSTNVLGKHTVIVLSYIKSMVLELLTLPSCVSSVR